MPFFTDNDMVNKIKDIVLRYTAATTGLVLVAFGVAFSIKSDLGTSPISCPPYVMELTGGLSIGQYTALMHMLFILCQIALLRKKFKAENLMQIAAAAVFGLLTDLSLMAVCNLAPANYLQKFGLLILSCVITAAGISIEVRSKAWMLAGEMTVAAISEVGKFKFRNVKIIFDTSLVAVSAIASYFLFGSLTGKGDLTVIREGTLISALLTGYLMKFTDPLANRLLGPVLDKYAAK